MTFVCNAGLIIALAKIDQLSLLHQIASSVMIPETVFYEVMAKPGPETHRILSASRSFLHVEIPPKALERSVRFASRHLDAGEREVIALASTIQPPVTAVLDDSAGRRVAAQLKIPVLGFVGLLLVAKKRRCITAVLPFVEQARNQGYWLSDELLEIVKSLAKE